MKRRIKVVDSPMGSGKTSAAIHHINMLGNDTNIMFVTPFLTECDRVIKKCESKNFVQPSEEEFGTKGRHLKALLAKGENIVCTHALFSYVDKELLDILREGHYVLFLDEVISVINEYDICKYFDLNITDREKQLYTMRDMSSFIRNGYVTIAPDFQVNWSTEEWADLSHYQHMKHLADNGLLYYINDSILFWTFPVQVFEEDIFDDIFILTYLFEHQIQAYYYRFYDITYEYYHTECQNGQYRFVPTINKDYEKEWKESVKPLIHICQNENLNEIGRPYVAKNNQEFASTLSNSWYTSHQKELKDVSRCIFNFLRSAPPKQRMYTTFKSFNKQVKPTRISRRAFVPLNAKATNEYGNRTHCAYMVNRYMNPFIKQLFSARNIAVDQDAYALADMVQWVWRSAIRNNEEIYLYIPSTRMRTLFTQWLNDEEISYVPYQKSRYFNKSRKKA